MDCKKCKFEYTPKPDWIDRVAEAYNRLRKDPALVRELAIRQAIEAHLPEKHRPLTGRMSCGCIPGVCECVPKETPVTYTGKVTYRAPHGTLIHVRLPDDIYWPHDNYQKVHITPITTEGEG